MRFAATLAGIALALAAWFAVIVLWDMATVRLLALQGMVQGDVEAPIVGLIAGGLYALALTLIVLSAIFVGRKPHALAYFGVGCAVLAEYGFCNHLYRLRRFLTPAYLDLPGIDSAPISLAQFTAPVWIAISLHAGVALALLALAFWVVSWRPMSKMPSG